MGEDAAAVRCDVCLRVIEVCACCQGEGCPDPICHRDLLRALHESVAQPHPHGG